MSSKLVIEKLNNISGFERISENEDYLNAVLAFRFEDDNLEEINFCDDKNIVGNIYVGYVKGVVKNIGAAFVEFGDKTGYFSLKDNKSPVYLNKKSSSKICSGDRVLVQVSKDKSKTKDYTVTSAIEFTGDLSLFIAGAAGIKFSAKIKDDDFKKDVIREANNAPEISAALIENKAGFLIRTNAYGKEIRDIIFEMQTQLNYFNYIKEKASHKMPRDIVVKSEHPLIQVIKNAHKDNVGEVVIEDKEV